MGRFILASNSERRKKFLLELGYDFDIHASEINEVAEKAEKPRDYVKRIALNKALSVKKDFPKRDILSSNTVIAVGRRIIGKAKDKNQAFDFIKLMSGRTHRVYTAVCLINKTGQIKIKVVESRVKFRPMSDNFIRNYVSDENNWKGFAGAYALQQTKGSSLVKSIIGSPSAIIGLPLYETQCLLEFIK